MNTLDRIRTALATHAAWVASGLSEAEFAEKVRQEAGTPQNVTLLRLTWGKNAHRDGYRVTQDNQLIRKD